MRSAVGLRHAQHPRLLRPLPRAAALLAAARTVASPPPPPPHTPCSVASLQNRLPTAYTQPEWALGRWSVP